MSVILPSVFKDGTVTIANGATAVTGVGMLWTQAILPGDFFGVQAGLVVEILSVTDDTHLVLADPWPGTSITAGAYKIMLQSDLGRMQETSRQLLTQMQSGNLYSFSGLAGVTDSLPIFTAPGTLGLISKLSLVSGVSYNVQVANLAGRAAYDANAQGYTVLVSDMGDGRAAIFSKNSNTVADWSAAAYVTGPVGPVPTMGISSTTTLAPGSNATVVATPVTGGQTLAFGIPRGRGFTNRGTYASGTAYILDDGVLYNGSSWICLASTTGNAPPNLPTTSNTWWQLVAIKGTDGTGIGDMVKSTYDPTNISASAFVRSNHTGDLPDSVLLANATTNTKKAKFDLSGIAAATTRTITLPDKSFKLDPSWVRIDDTPFTAVGGYSLTGLGAFNRIRLSGNMTLAAAALMIMQVSSDGGATWDAANNWQQNAGTGASNATASGTSSYIDLTNGNVAHPFGLTFSMEMELNVQSGAPLRWISRAGYLLNATGVAVVYDQFGYSNAGTRKTALRIILGVVTTMTGRIVVEGSYT